MSRDPVRPDQLRGIFNEAIADIQAERKEPATDEEVAKNQAIDRLFVTLRDFTSDIVEATVPIPEDSEEVKREKEIKGKLVQLHLRLKQMELMLGINSISE